MTFLRSIVVAFSMFSRIPMPKVDWKPENMRYALAAFPLVGCVIGLALWGWAWLCGRLAFARRCSPRA
jgi:adenosylcobinamide-GDP ribazoletransferase